VLYIVKNVYLAFFTYAQARYVYRRQISLGCRLFRAYLNSPYTFFLQRNSAELIHNTNNEAFRVVGDIVVPGMRILMEALVLVAVLCLLVSLEPVVSLALVVLLGGACLIFLRVVRGRVAQLGLDEYRYKKHMIQWVNQGIGGIRDVKLLGRERYFADWFSRNAVGYVHAGQYRAIAIELPRLFLEAVTVLAISGIAVYLLWQHRALDAIVPILSLLAVAAMRLVPSTNRITAAIVSLRFGLPALDAIYSDIRELEAHTAAPEHVTLVPFESSIEYQHVTFQYPGTTQPVLSDVNLRITRGAAVGLVGPSGSGKTTLVDILLGLLEPTMGCVLVDGRDTSTNLPGWQRQIGYVPQAIYLLDDSVRRNIAFGLSDTDISDDRVWAAVDAAQLRELVDTLPQGLDTSIGEQGIRLSGGQRQRLGIARALYHDPAVLVMDEATSALDRDTETEVVRAIARLKGSRTIITIAHRTTTVKECDTIYELRDGELRMHQARDFFAAAVALA
jgi:ATP-binding cassette subfamily C protein